MEQENNIKTWLTASVFEYSCKKNVFPVIEKVLKDKESCLTLPAAFSVVPENAKPTVKPIFIFIQILRNLQSSVENFASESTDVCYSWNSESLSKIIRLVEITYEQCEFMSIKKFFSLLLQLKFLDLMHLLRSQAESSALMQKLNLHFPRWGSSQKECLAKKFVIENPKVLDKVEESCSQCRKLILKLVTDMSYRSVYMKEQFSADMKKMMLDSVILLQEVISNLTSNAGSTVIEKVIDEPSPSDSSDLANQLLIDYLQPDITAEALIKLLNELEPALEPPSGGFSSCLLPFDTLSECSDVPMESDCDQSDSESCSDESDEEKDKTLTDIHEDSV